MARMCVCLQAALANGSMEGADIKRVFAVYDADQSGEWVTAHVLLVATPTCMCFSVLFNSFCFPVR